MHTYIHKWNNMYIEGSLVMWDLQSLYAGKDVTPYFPVISSCLLGSMLTWKEPDIGEFANEWKLRHMERPGIQDTKSDQKLTSLYFLPVSQHWSRWLHLSNQSNECFQSFHEG